MNYFGVLEERKFISLPTPKIRSQPPSISLCIRRIPSREIHPHSCRNAFWAQKIRHPHRTYTATAKSTPQHSEIVQALLSSFFDVAVIKKKANRNQFTQPNPRSCTLSYRYHHRSIHHAELLEVDTTNDAVHP